MNTVLSITHLVVTILLILSILSQNRGSGLSATFGGTGQFYVEKRGAEKVLYRATMALGVLFVLLSLLFIFV
jgi:preprotein translocase subunit SecG